MKKTIFTGIPAEKVLELLRRITAPGEKGSEENVWKAPGKKNEWARLTGKWEGNTFRGKLFRTYNGERSGGMALPRLILEVESGGSMGKLHIQTGFSFAYWLMNLVFALVAVMLGAQIVRTFPAVTPVSVIAFIGWLLLFALVFAMTYSQYKHECGAITQVLKDMTKGFDG